MVEIICILIEGIEAMEIEEIIMDDNIILIGIQIIINAIIMEVVIMKAEIMEIMGMITITKKLNLIMWDDEVDNTIQLIIVKVKNLNLLNILFLFI